MKPGDKLKDKLTGKTMKFVKYLNDEKSLLLVNYNGDGEITVIKEEVEPCS